MPRAPYYIDVDAFDQVGNQTRKTHIFYEGPGDTFKPQATLTTPAENSSVTQLTSLSGTAYDPPAPDGTSGSGVNSVDLVLSRQNSATPYWNGSAWAASGSMRANLSTPNAQGIHTWIYNNTLPSGAQLAPGSYLLEIYAYDRYINVAYRAFNFSVAAVPGKIIYVSPNGGTVGSGDTLSNPVSISRAMEIAQENDQIVFRGGTYNITGTDAYKVGIRVDKAGLYLKNFDGEKPILVASAAADSTVANVLVITKSRVVISGLEIRGGSSYGIKIDGEDAGPQVPISMVPTNGVIVRNCRIGYTGADCIKAYIADNLLIENCDIGPSGSIDTGNAEGIDSIGSRVVKVLNCNVHDTATTGIYFKGGTVDGLVEGCNILNAGDSGILLGQDTETQFFRSGSPRNSSGQLLEAQRCVARNNTVTNTGSSGIGTWSSEDTLFENNTLTNVANQSSGGFAIRFNRLKVPASGVKFFGNTVQLSGGTFFVYVYAEEGKVAGVLSSLNNHYRYTGPANPDYPKKRFVRRVMRLTNGDFTDVEPRAFFDSFEEWRSVTGYDAGSDIGPA